MNTKSFTIRRSLLVMSAGFVLFAFGDRSLSQDAVQKETEFSQILTDRPMLPPGTRFFPDQDSFDNPGTVRPNLDPLLIPPSAGAPGFDPSNRPELHPGQLAKIHHPESHGPVRRSEGPFAEDRKRIAALTDAAERITQAGLPDVAHGLRERAEQLERELAEKQERMQQEARKRIESAMRERQEHARQQPQPHQPQRLMEQRLMGQRIMEQRLMEQRFEGIERGDHPTPPLRELHEQMEQIRRDMHKLSEQMADLTRLIQQHHNPRNDRSHHEEDGDEEDGDEEDGNEEDGNEEDGNEEDGNEEDRNEEVGNEEVGNDGD